MGSSLVSLQKKSRGHVKIGYYMTKQVVNFKSPKLGAKFKNLKKLIINLNLLTFILVI